MASIAATRAALAEALTGLGGLTVTTRQPGTVRALDGWVNVGPVRPSPHSVASCDATFTAVLALSADRRVAEDLVDALSVDVLDAVTKGALHPDGVSLEPAEIPAGDVAPGSLFALVLTLTLEVD